MIQQVYIKLVLDNQNKTFVSFNFCDLIIMQKMVEIYQTVSNKPDEGPLDILYFEGPLDILYFAGQNFAAYFAL